MLAHPGFYSVVAEAEGTIVGSNFLDERSTVAGLGPITVEIAGVQNRAIGRQLMQDTLDRVKQRRVPGRAIASSRLSQPLALPIYKIGIRGSRAAIATMQGAPPVAVQVPGYSVHPATELDLDACNQICVKVHGHDRGGEMLDAIKQKTATVVERAGRITGYAGFRSRSSDTLSPKQTKR